MGPSEFLQAWIPNGPWSLAAIHPDEPKSTAWLTVSNIAEAEKFIERQASLGRNLYLQYNICHPMLGGKRASSEDVVAALGVHVEIDPPVRVRNLADLEAWQIVKTEQLVDDEYWFEKDLPQPTLVAFSGSGFVVAWRFEERFLLWTGDPPVQSPERVAEITRRNRKLVELLEGDGHSTDASRLLRLPGTLNYPNRAKRENYGRLTAIRAEVLDFDLERRCKLEDIPAAEATIDQGPRELREFKGLPDAERRMAAIHALGDAWPPSGKRHDAQLKLAGALAHAGWPVEAIAEFCAEVAEYVQAGTGEYDNKRLPTARSSVDKIKAGEPVSGWPKVIELVGEEVVNEVTSALGINQVIGDDEFAAAVASAGRDERPDRMSDDEQKLTSADIDAALLRAERSLARSKKAEHLRDAALLKKVRKHHTLADHEDDYNACTAYAALAMVRACPEATTLMLAERLVTSRIDLSVERLVSFCERAVERVAKEASASAVDTQFVLESSGPRAGQPKANQHNLDIALRKLGIKLTHDEFSNRRYVQTDDSPPEVIEDQHTTRMYFRIEQEFAIRCDNDYWLKYVNDRAWQNRYHPVRDYLDSLPAWTGGEAGALDLLETWLIRSGQAPDNAYVRAVSRLVLVAAIRRIRRPGCTYQEIVVLEGDQGAKKSMALATLCPKPEWFTSELPLHEDTKTLMEHTSGKWIIESGELAGLSRSDDNKLKSYLSREVDEARAAYGREPRRALRQFVVIATTNESQYLRDPSGNRRWWPIRTVKFDIEWLRSARDMLWSAAAFLDEEHPEDEYIRLDPSLYSAAADEQAAREVDDPFRVMLEQIFAGRTGRVRQQDTWKILGWEEGKVPAKQGTLGLTNALRSMGWRPERHVIAGIRSSWYERGTPAEREVVLNVVGTTMSGWRLQVANETEVRQPGTPSVVPPTHRTPSQGPPVN